MSLPCTCPRIPGGIIQVIFTDGMPYCCACGCACFAPPTAQEMKIWTLGQLASKITRVARESIEGAAIGNVAEILHPYVCLPEEAEWQPIESCPENEPAFFTSYYVPSDYAARNGAKPCWNYGAGRRLGTIYTGILGIPSHYKLATPPTESKKL